MALLTHLDQDVTNGRDEQHSSSNAAGQPRTPLHRTGAWWQFPHITDRTALNKLRQLEDLCHGQDRALRRMLASSAADAAGIPRQQLVVFDGRRAGLQQRVGSNGIPLPCHVWDRPIRR